MAQLLSSDQPPTPHRHAQRGTYARTFLDDGEEGEFAPGPRPRPESGAAPR
jgi:hypothetical protein